MTSTSCAARPRIFGSSVADYGVNYDKFMNWQRHQLWSEKLGKTVQAEQPKVAKVQITGKPCNSPTVKLEVKHPEGESPIKWVKLQLTSGATTVPEKHHSSGFELVA